MKTEKNFTTGLFTGILASAILLLVMGYSTSSSDSVSKYEFYDLNTTKGLIFNKVTGEIKYETIRDNNFTENQKIELTIKGAVSYPESPVKFEIDNN
jgi:hypothetical protein